MIGYHWQQLLLKRIHLMTNSCPSPLLLFIFLPLISFQSTPQINVFIIIDHNLKQIDMSKQIIQRSIQHRNTKDASPADYMSSDRSSISSILSSSIATNTRDSERLQSWIDLWIAVIGRESY